MNNPDDLDPLEAELQALRPCDVSPDLHGKIAAQLARAARPRSRWIRRVTIAGGALAAAGLVAVVFFRADRPVDIGQNGNRESDAAPAAPEPVAETVANIPPPSVLVYSRALAGPAEELDSLFDQHARLGSQRESGETRVFAFTRPDDTFHPLSGEL